MLRFLIFISSCLVLLQACVSVKVDKIDAVDGFDWETLKRDLIVMTPLLDLRGQVQHPPGYDADVLPFSQKQSVAFAEVFKQRFFKLRKDIQVFGAGGAFDGIAKIAILPEISRKVLAKETLSLSDQRLLNRARQDKRFIFFFNFAEEKLHFEYSMTIPLDANGLYVEKHYDAKRTMILKFALWDAKEAKTVFISEKILEPFTRNNILVRTGLSPLAVKGGKGQYDSARDPDVYDRMGTDSLEDELRYHKGRFPTVFPRREPDFTGSFDDFILSLPIKKSEQNLIEYENFTFHRPELTLRNSEMGSDSMASVFLGSSSIIYNRYRVGLGVELGAASKDVRHDGKDYEISKFCFCLTTDLEWELTDYIRLLTGSVLGAGNFGITQKIDDQLVGETSGEKPETSDGFWYAAPRIRLVFGEKEGVQFGLGAFKQFHAGLVEPQITKNSPGTWGAELSLMATFRGF